MKLPKARIREIIQEEIQNLFENIDPMNLKKVLADYYALLNDQDELIKEIVFAIYTDNDSTNDDSAQKIVDLHVAYKKMIEDLIKSV